MSLRDEFYAGLKEQVLIILQDISKDISPTIRRRLNASFPRNKRGPSAVRDTFRRLENSICSKILETGIGIDDTACVINFYPVRWKNQLIDEEIHIKIGITLDELPPFKIDEIPCILFKGVQCSTEYNVRLVVFALKENNDATRLHKICQVTSATKESMEW